MNKASKLLIKFFCSIFLSISIIFSSGCVLFEEKIPKPSSSYSVITPQSQQELDRLNTQHINYSYQNNQLVLGNDKPKAKLKQLFLVRNASMHPIVIDFKAGHIGASAGLMQMIQSDEWLLYLYIKDKDTLPTENEDGQKVMKRPAWSCRQGDPDYEEYPSCRDYLDIYSINYDVEDLKKSKNITDYYLLQIINADKKSGWLTISSYATIKPLFAEAAEK